ncbi:MAG: hypothetical protein DRJ96_03385 [Thermoprotei archaeon]|nr:MAG: hypothetical protein DRJ96_03385 [Thermoprotei archaeon]
MARTPSPTEGLQEIQMLIILRPGLVREFVREVLEAVRRAGLNAYPRAEGYAFMRDEIVGRLGLPHLRCAVMLDRVVVWVRDPYNLRNDLLSAAGMSADEYFEEIMVAAGEIARVYEKYRALASGYLLKLP